MRRPIAIFSVLVLLVAAGCGSDDEPETTTTNATTTSTDEDETGIAKDIAPRGPIDPATNLKELVEASGTGLERAQVKCPEVAFPPEYPFECTIRAFDSKEKVNVSGKLTVQGVYRPTRTYVFETSVKAAGGDDES